MNNIKKTLLLPSQRDFLNFLSKNGYKFRLQQQEKEIIHAVLFNDGYFHDASKVVLNELRERFLRDYKLHKAGI